MHACYLNCPVDVQVEWPRERAEFQFGQWTIIAFPPSRDHDPSLHIDLTRHRLSSVQGASILNQVLSIAAWLDDTYAVLLEGWSGNPVPCRPQRQTRCFQTSILNIWCNAWGAIEDFRVRRVLGIYREAMNMGHFHSLPYAVLGYYKILETTLPGRARANYLERALDQYLAENKLDDYRVQVLGFEMQPTAKEMADFIFEEGRQAIAHANKLPVIDPDNVAHQRKMSVAASVLRPIARRYIRTELHVGINRWDQSHLD